MSVIIGVIHVTELFINVLLAESSIENSWSITIKANYGWVVNKTKQMELKQFEMECVFGLWRILSVVLEGCNNVKLSWFHERW